MSKSQLEKEMLNKIEEALNNLDRLSISNKLKAEAILQNLFSIQDEEQSRSVK